MGDNILIEDTLQEVPKKCHARLNMDVELAFRNVEEVVLGGVSQPVDRLQDQGLLLLQVLDLSVAKRPPHARVEADRLLGSPLTNSPSPVQDRGLQ